MSEKLNKDQISEMLKAIKPDKPEDPVDKYTELLKTVSSSGNDNSTLPFLLMMMNQSGSKGMDKMAEALTNMQMIKMFAKMSEGDDGDKISELIKSMKEDTDKKIEALTDKFTEAIKEIAPKPKSEEAQLLEKLLEKLSSAENKGDTDEVDRTIKLIEAIRPKKEEGGDSLDTITKIFALANNNNDKYIALKEDILKQQNDATQQALDQALAIIKNQENNSDWLSKLQESTQTINKFQSFMESSGLKPTPKEAGKVDLKYVLDTVSDVIKNIAPALPKPKQNPSWDLDKETNTLYNKYKDIITTEDGTPITKDFVKSQLERNPNVEHIWQEEIKSQMKTYGMSSDIPEGKTVDEQVKDIFEGIDKKSAPVESADIPAPVESADIPAPAEKTDEEPAKVEEPKGKFVKGMKA